MEQDGHRVRLPKLASNGANWVVYRDRIIWAMLSVTATTSLPSCGGPRMKTNQIKQVLCSTLPDTAFNRIKNAACIKDAWDTLKRVYEERSKALVADVMRRFRNNAARRPKACALALILKP